MASQPPLPPSSLFDVSTAKGNENELADYRKISPMALVSLVFGLASMLCFLDTNWLVMPVLAIVAGILGLRKINKYSDIATGRSYAQAGIALALICSIGSFTYSKVTIYQVSREVTQFAQEFVKVLNDRKVGKATLFLIAPEYLRGVPPDQWEATAEKMLMSNRVGDAKAGIDRILAALTKPTDRVEFVSVDAPQVDELVARAVATLKVGPEGKIALVYARSGGPATTPRTFFIEYISFSSQKEGEPEPAPAAASSEKARAKIKKGAAKQDQSLPSP